MEEISRGIKIVRTLKRIHHMVKRSMVQHFEDTNITGPQMMLMGILSNKGQMKISDLSQKIGLSNSTVSGIVDRLEKQGLVERLRSQEDRRIVYVNLTLKAKDTMMEQFEKIEQNFDDILKNVSPEEIDIIIKGFETLEKVMDRQENNI
jgi:MarR family transcriptional regulator, organic hydroperoxide resistance regulator